MTIGELSTIHFNRKKRGIKKQKVWLFKVSVSLIIYLLNVKCLILSKCLNFWMYLDGGISMWFLMSLSIHSTRISIMLEPSQIKKKTFPSVAHTQNPFLLFFISVTRLWHCSTWSASLQPRRSLPERAEGGTGWVDRLSFSALVPWSPVVCWCLPIQPQQQVCWHRTKMGYRGQGLLHSKLELLFPRLLTYSQGGVFPSTSYKHLHLN